MLLPTRLCAGTMRLSEERRITGCSIVEHALSLQRAGGRTRQQDATVPGSGRGSSHCHFCNWLANVHPRWCKRLLPVCLTSLMGRHATGCFLPRCANPKGRCFARHGSPHCSRRRIPATVAFFPWAAGALQLAILQGQSVSTFCRPTFLAKEMRRHPGAAGSWMSVTDVRRHEVFAACEQSCAPAVYE